MGICVFKNDLQKKGVKVLSAINLKDEKSIISKIKKLKFSVSSYDRVKEPNPNKIKGSSVEWGITNAIKNLKSPPDIIFHKGDFGKEPMIIIFGEKPKNILKKLSKIIG